MKKLFILCLLFYQCTSISNPDSGSTYLTQNRAPLQPKPYLELPLGAIRPNGWLHDQLERMKSGLTGHLDEVYPEVVGKRNGWLGGDGDGWERGPYWIDGLLPLAYILDDDELKAKVKPWVEWTLNNQAPSGYLGPIPFTQPPADERGLQRGMRRDWWPKMVMLKILQQYYSATGDERVIKVLTNYFRFQLEELPKTPLDHWTFWANRRGGDNLMVVYWLYNITGDEFLLELGELIARQTFPWKEVFLNPASDSTAHERGYYFSIQKYPFAMEELQQLSVAQKSALHCVNFAQGVKEPVVYFQQNKDKENLKATKKALRDIQQFHGQPQGMYSGDEGLHGRDPVQGIEFCSISELMFSLETMLTITGDMEFADHIEKIVYNALPTQATDEFSGRQYFQAANQIELSDQIDPSYEAENHEHTDFVYGILTGYPCCTTNMHQSWPKFVQNLWYATADRGVAAFLYAPSTVSLEVGDDIHATISEETAFPFDEEITFSFQLDQAGTFPFHLRIPSWTNEAMIRINGKPWKGKVSQQIARINRTWKDGDKVVLTLPMQLKASHWYDSAATIERGPLVYSLKIDGKSRMKSRNDRFGKFRETYPVDPWNYALLDEDLEQLTKRFTVITKEWDGSYPWNLENVPIRIKARGILIDEWKLKPEGPRFPKSWTRENSGKTDSITLVPYGATTLRVTEFPVVKSE